MVGCVRLVSASCDHAADDEQVAADLYHNPHCCLCTKTTGVVYSTTDGRTSIRDDGAVYTGEVHLQNIPDEAFTAQS